MNYETLTPYIEKKLISEQAHPENGDVRIFNYTQETQFSKAWDDVTRQARGLILNVATGEVIARPFPKFFNLAEHVQNAWPIPNSTPIVTEKLDGSLGILYWMGDTPWVATRGSFTSEQAVWATKWFRNHAVFDEYDRGMTYLFEVLAFWNRIVVQYDYEGLVLLAINETKGPGFCDIRGPKGILSQRSTRDNIREHMDPPMVKMEAVSGLQKRDNKKGLSKTQREEEEIPSNLEQRKQGQGNRATFPGLPEDSRFQERTKEGPMRRLSQDIPSVRDGFRPREGGEVEGRGENPNPGGDTGRDKEVRLGMFKLSQNQDLSNQKIRTSKAMEFTNIEDLMRLDEPNGEGFVVFYPKENVRMKIKFPEYVRLHKIVTGISEIGIWEMLKDGKELKELIEKVPDEFFRWVSRVSTDLLDRYDGIANEAEKIFESVKGLPTRKEQALAIQNRKYPGVVFALLDGEGKEAYDQIWKMLRPHGKRVFKADIDI